MTTCVTCRVVKVGGSLLTSPTLVDDLRRWLSLQPPARTLLLAGGGALVDAIAEQQRSLGFDDYAAHWLCIRAMQIHYEMLAALMPDCERVATFGDHVSCDPSSVGRIGWLDPWALMQHDLACAKATLRLDPLPADWSVSSDSIAARAAKLIGAEDLVLLKSTLSSSATEHYVDGYFDIASQGIASVRFVNLRDPQFAEERRGI